MSRRILIIEDNETNLQLMVYLLQEYGYMTLTARDGEEGLAAISRERPDLVLCDVHMPGLNGYEVAQRVKADAELRKIPIVAVSALAMIGDREKGLAAGFDSYISKPIDPKSFIKQIEALTGGGTMKPPHRGLILTVDDLSANNKLLHNLLEPFGYEVVSTSGMTDAMAQARQLLPDLIISDVQMHEGDGYHLCEAVKTDARLQHIPVILITSTYCDEDSRKQGLAMGAARYLFRPIDSRALLKEIEDCVATRK
ncbi:MAG TPA: response regulator [Opitutales bacterium]|nr:response regulator [Opitutales bacterium]